MGQPVTPNAPPLPRPRVLRQSWLDLTFVHWAVDPASIAHFYPAGIRPDTFAGRAYVGLIPFRMVATGFARGPALLGDFLETNIRLYSVDASGRRGVFFLSLDTDRLDVVAVARTIFGLPYRWASMQYDVEADVHTYTTRSLRRVVGRAEDPDEAVANRAAEPADPVASRIAVRVGEPLEAGPLEHFLTARWGLHVRRASRTWYLPNEHPVWPLRSAELLDLQATRLLASVGLPDLTTRPPDHVAHSPGVRSYFGLPRGSASH
ncbi:YqjF family protein [Kribbella sp. CA-253562]|uniref:YqjF family protein n=1 Tax=Kribbella sp. CA-253562 TaxID=3239942 RepID=UPI003D921C8C